MAKAIVNPEAELTSRPGDVHLTEELLAALGVFASLKKTPAFAKFPGTCVLRHYRPGEVICRQGEAGGTAFYLLTVADIESLSRHIVEQPAGQQRESLLELQRLLPGLRRSGTGMATAASTQPRRLATARLLVDTARRTGVRPRNWLQSLWPIRNKSPRSQARPATIANDGPADIDYQTRQAPFYEGEVFGEMSCLMRQPRSATVVVDAECFVLEFLRNILEQMRKDSKYNEEAEKKYRERVLEGHLRQLPLFQSLNDNEFRLVQERVELVRLAPGSVIWDEGDPSDALYVVRSGVVQVIQSYPWRVSEDSVSDWPKLMEAMRPTTETAPEITRLRSALPKEFQQTLASSSGEPAMETAALIHALNELAKTDVLLTAKEMQNVMADARMTRETAAFPPKVKSWTGLQLRRANRLLYHVLFPQLVRTAEPAGLSRVMQYLGRGSIVGEIGVVRRKARTATCVAYAHPQFDREATDVELVRVPADVIYEIEAKSKRVRSEIEKLIESREERSADRLRAPVEALAESRRAEDLGLLQGQNLMLIDLDRCTRCGDCVQACIDTHDDGYSRLFLDGPRFGKYLIPSSCRQCRDPVCMIGCPVGSIQQGDDGEIHIREWCIGCGLCAGQCPYDSIQMHDAALLPSGAPGWLWIDDASAAADGNWSQSSYQETNWRPASAPFLWGIEMHHALAASLPAIDAGKVRRLYFRFRFRIDSRRHASTERHRLLITSQGSSLEACLNGQRVELSQDAAQKKRSQFVADIDRKMVQAGENLLAIAVVPPVEFNATVLDARLDSLARESEEAEEKLITERAVVCDQCSSLSGSRHACVYACPHEAAIRVDTWTAFPAN